MNSNDRNLADHCEHALDVLKRWKSTTRLSRADRNTINNLITGESLVVIPIWGVAALSRVSTPMARNYVSAGIFVPIARYYRAAMFETANVLRDGDEFLSLKNQGLTVAEAGERIRSARDAAG